MVEAVVVLAGPGGFAAGAVLSYAAPTLIRRRLVWARRGVALLAAAGGALAAAAPTTIGIVDVVLAGGLAAAVTLLGARVRPSLIAVTSAVTAVVSAGSPGLAFGLAAAGAALAFALTARKAPLATVVVAALIANALLRLRLPGPHGAESLVAGAVASSLAVLAHREMRRTTKRRLRGVGFVVAGAMLAMALSGLLALTLSRPGLERGVSYAGRGYEAARTADQARARAELRSARDAFAAAAEPLDAWWAQPARLVPVLSQHLRALGVAAGTGQRLATAGGRVATAADLNGVRITNGALPLEPIVALQQPLAAARADVASAVHELSGVRSGWLAPPVSRRLDANLVRLAESEASLRTSADVVRVLPGLLGADGPRRWFLAVQTPSEARATGGFIGNFGEIVTDGGSFELARSGRIAELNLAGPADRTLRGPADYLERYARFGVATTWQNVNLSPDLPTVAEVVGGLYPQSGGAPVDGLLAIDPAGVAAFLDLTGPLDVPQWPEPLTSANAERILLYDQYVAFGDSAERVNFLGDATDLLWKRLTAGQLPEPQAILAKLGPAVAGKHLMVTSLRGGAEEATLRRAGINGEVAEVDDDALAVVTQNASGSKIDWFLHRKLRYEAHLDAGGRSIRATVSVTLRNDAPAAGLPTYLIGNALVPPLPSGTNRTYVSVYTPWGLTAARLDGSPTTVESAAELDRRVYSTYLDLPPGGEVTLELDLSGSRPARATYAIDLHAQPQVNPEEAEVVVAAAGERSVQRTVLDRDRTFRFGEAS